MADTNYTKPANLAEARANPRYHGKIVISGGGEVHGTYSAQRAQQIFRRLQRKYPDKPPISTVIPKGPIMPWMGLA